MQSWFLSWQYSDENGNTAAGWSIFTVLAGRDPADITDEYVKSTSIKMGLDVQKIILVAFNKV